MGQFPIELLSIVFGFMKFYQSYYGRDVIEENDHLPLQGLLKKPLHSIPARLQRLVMKFTPYMFQFLHMPGKNTISRWS
jgi:hypothetical protein